LPGIIDEPGSSAGIRSSPSPQRGPEASQHTSFAILSSAAAAVLRPPASSASASWPASAANLSGAVTNGWPVFRASALAISSAKRGAGEPQLRAPAADLLAEREGRRVLEVRTAELDHVPEGPGPLVQRRPHPIEREEERLVERQHRGHVHRRREGVVARLAPVDVVVGVDRVPVPAAGAGQLVGAVGDHLVDVHVGLGARAGLPDDQREVLVELPLDHLLRRARDERSGFGVQLAERGVDLCGRLLDQAVGAQEDARQALRTDPEVLQAALGLRTPVAVGGNPDLTHAVRLDAELHGESSSPCASTSGGAEYGAQLPNASVIAARFSRTRSGLTPAVGG
jgi:hypothetical protein